MHIFAFALTPPCASTEGDPLDHLIIQSVADYCRLLSGRMACRKPCVLMNLGSG